MTTIPTDRNELGLDPRPGADVTPTGYNAAVEVSPGKLTGSSGNDRITIEDLQRDSDQIIKAGAGDDVFIFGVNDTDGNINAIVDLGTGSDSVYFTHMLEDYKFTLRSDGGIKFEYIGDSDGDGAAVTIRGGETFVFRNIDDQDTSLNYTNQTFSYDELVALIAANTVV